VYAWYKQSPGTFERSARKSAERENLKKETKWTDEQLEGFRSMILRDGRTLRRLEMKYEQRVFQQDVIPRTAWKSPEEGEGEIPRPGRARKTRGGSNVPGSTRG
jgi:activating signal cointegrator complex subunit 2